MVTEDGDFFHAQLREKKWWDEAWIRRRDWYSSDYHEHMEDRWIDHPWTNFWVSTRAPRHFAGLDAEPTTAAADACARDVEKEFHRGCLGTCGKTCGELGHDPVLFEKLKAAVKKWPDGGGGEAIPDVCAFHPKFAWDQDGLWITWLQVLAWLGILFIYVVGVAAACCVSQPSCLGYAWLQKLRNWVNEGEGGCARRCVFWCCGGWIFVYIELSLRRPALLWVTIVPTVLVSTLPGLGIIWEPLVAFLLFIALFLGGNLFFFRDEVRARCQKLSWPALFCVTVVPLALAATLAGPRGSRRSSVVSRRSTSSWKERGRGRSSWSSTARARLLHASATRASRRPCRPRRSRTRASSWRSTPRSSHRHIVHIRAAPSCRRPTVTTRRGGWCGSGTAGPSAPRPQRRARRRRSGAERCIADPPSSLSSKKFHVTEAPSWGGGVDVLLHRPTPLKQPEAYVLLRC